MGRPTQEKSLDGVSSATAGSGLTTGGRITVSLFVVANNGDTGSDTLDVQLEVSMDGTNWTPLRDETGTQIGQLTIAEFADPDSNSDPAAFLTVHGVAGRHVRARVTSFTDSAGGDLTVDAWVSTTSNTPTSKDYREV